MQILKNSNYDSKNIPKFKNDTTSDLFGAIGYLAELNLFKSGSSGYEHFFTPKIFTRFSPNYMKNETEGSRLNMLNVYKLNRVESKDNFEGGLNATIGFDYSLNDRNKNEKFKISMAQILNENENKNMPSKMSLDEKLSDLVGSINFNKNQNLKFDYNFLIDQNYQDLNYSELGVNFSNDLIKFNIDYLKEDNHVGDKNYVKTGLSFFRKKILKYHLIIKEI